MDGTLFACDLIFQNIQGICSGQIVPFSRGTYRYIFLALSRITFNLIAYPLPFFVIDNRP